MDYAKSPYAQAALQGQPGGLHRNGQGQVPTSAQGHAKHRRQQQQQKRSSSIITEASSVMAGDVARCRLVTGGCRLMAGFVG